MRILLISDLHYSLRQFDWVNLVSERFDLVTIAGDLLDISSIVDLETQALVVMKYFRRIRPKTKLLVSSGNHDITGSNECEERLAGWLKKGSRHGLHVDGDRYDFEDFRFTICPWWDGPRTRKHLERQLQHDSKDRPRNWVWICHSPPQDRPVSWTGKTHLGDSHVRQWIETHQPAMVFSGHVHQSPFRPEGSWVDKIGDTYVFNPGFQIGPEPTCIIVDTEARTAVWTSQMGQERAHLDRDLVSRQEMEIS